MYTPEELERSPRSSLLDLKFGPSRSLSRSLHRGPMMAGATTNQSAGFSSWFAPQSGLLVVFDSFDPSLGQGRWLVVGFVSSLCLASLLWLSMPAMATGIWSIGMLLFGDRKFSFFFFLLVVCSHMWFLGFRLVSLVIYSQDWRSFFWWILVESGNNERKKRHFFF